MRCIFCKNETTNAEPVEHILPESLGNTRLILRRGVVCGKCNNYFASKVEKPFLEALPLKTMRFHQAVASKKGRVPMLHGVFLPNAAPAVLMRGAKDGMMHAHVDSLTFKALASQRSGKLILPLLTDIEPNETASRFLAKVALEAMAQRVEHNDQWLNEWTDWAEMDPLRRYARYGVPNKWPIAVRRIYPENARWSDSEAQDYQIVHESDFLYTDRMELYFVLAIFGQEMAINVAGPDIEGWDMWVKENKNASPLHSGKNAGKQFMR